jgi:glycosyltransferase involved in cell wall biosynthesis
MRQVEFEDRESIGGWHLAWIYAGSLAGALDASTWLRTSKELRALGWRVTLIGAGDRGLQDISGMDVLCFSRPEIYILRQVAFHLRVLGWLYAHCGTTDIILFHEMSAAWILPLRIILRLKGERCPLMVMDSRSLPMTDEQVETWKDRVRRLAFRIDNRIGNAWSDGRTAITERLAEALHVPSKKLWGTWPSGAAAEDFSSARGKRGWPPPEGPVRLIYHGALHRERNLATLCQAVMQANERGMCFSLTLAGDGTDRFRLVELASRSKGVIEVVASVPYAAVPGLLAHAHVGVLPFTNDEKFRVSSPIKLFEYMAAGMPILATQIVCHTDVVLDGKFVFWAEAADESALLEGLKQVWNGRDALPEMGREAGAASNSWTWAAAAVKLADALERGIREAGRLSPGSQAQAVALR